MKVRGKIILTLAAILYSILPLNAQRYLEKGNRFFGLNQFEKAIPFYIREMKESGDQEVKKESAYKLADCYRLTGDFENAEEIYKTLLRKGGSEAMFKYGAALKAAAKYAEAKKIFQKYVRKYPTDPRGPIMLESCDIAQNLLDSDWQYDVRELKTLNTENEEISPLLYRGGIVFSSQRPGGIKPFISLDASSAEILLDLYYIEFDETEESLSNDIYLFPSINTAMHEGPASFTGDGNTVYYTTTVKGKRSGKSSSDLQNTLQVFKSQLHLRDEVWTESVSAFPFNSEKYSVMHPSVSEDGKKIVFASDMPGGYGGTDIYMSFLKKDGTWSPAFNLGPEVNSTDNELFPFLSREGKVYFSSNGHPGMGKLDIFECILDPYYGWTKVENMGVPINSIGDDICFTQIGSSGRGLFVSDRINGTGKADIYAYTKIQPIEIEFDDEKLWVKDHSAFDAYTYSIKVEGTEEDLELSKDKGFFSYVPETDVEYRLTVRRDGFSYNRILFTVGYTEHGNRQIKIVPKKGDVKLKLFTGKLQEEQVVDTVRYNPAVATASSKDKKTSLWDRLKIAIVGTTTTEYDIKKLMKYQPVNVHDSVDVESGLTISQSVDGEVILEQETNEDGYAEFLLKKRDENLITILRNFEGKRIPFPYNEETSER